MKCSGLHRWRVMIALLLALCLVLPMMGCAGTPTEFDNDLKLLSTSGVSIFRVVCSQDDYPAEVAQAAERVQEALAFMLGVEVRLVDDRDCAEAPDLVMPYEVLVGHTARRESQEVLATLGQDEWTIRMVGHKIVVLGETNRATLEAVEYFITQVLGYTQGMTENNPGLKIDPDYNYIAKYEVELRSNGAENGILPGAPHGATVLYPISLPEKHSDRVSLATLQGLAAASGGEHILVRDSAYELYLPYINSSRVTIEEKDDYGNDWTFATLLARYRDKLDGYILCDASTTSESSGVAISLARHLNAVVVSADNVQAAVDAGLACLLDVTDKNDTWLRTSQYFALLNRSLAVEQSVVDAPGLIDYAVMTGSYYYYYSGNDAYLHGQQFKFLDSGAYVLLGNGSKNYLREQSLVDIGLVPLSTESIANASTLSGCLFTAVSLGKSVDQVEATEDVHTVCFVVSGGEGMSWMVNRMPADARWYASESRGDFAVTWSLGEMMFDLTPTLLTYFGNTATERDDFVLTVSPRSQTSGEESATYAADVCNVMKQMLLGHIQTSVYDETFCYQLLSDPSVRGIVCAAPQYGVNEAGSILQMNGKPVVTARHTMTISAADGTPEAIAQALNEAATDVHSQEGYSVVVIDATVGLDADGNLVDGGDTMAAIEAIVNALQDNVQVVTVAELIARVGANVK